MSDAWQPWTPTYLDIVHRRAEGDPQYQNAGFDSLVFSPEDVNLAQHRAVLTERFFERYANRRISQETLQRWQVRLQNRFDEIADRYERAYRIYAEYADDMDDDVLEGWKETHSGKDTDDILGSESLEMSGSEKDSATSKTTDTPDAVINAAQNYADTVRSTEAERSFANRKDTKTYAGRKNERTWGHEITRILTGSAILENVNLSIESWKDIDTLFVGEFEDLFLNIFDYRGRNDQSITA